MNFNFCFAEAVQEEQIANTYLFFLIFRYFKISIFRVAEWSAVIAVPMFTLDAVFSATERVVLVPSVNVGVVFVVVGAVLSAISSISHEPLASLLATKV